MTTSVEQLLRVLVVVHNRILRDGLSCLIDMRDELELAGTASTADEAVTRFMISQPDITWMDLDLPGDAGLDAIRRIRETDAEAWIVALVTHEDDERVSEAISAGAAAVVAKHDMENLVYHRASRTVFTAQVGRTA